MSSLRDRRAAMLSGTHAFNNLRRVMGAPERKDAGGTTELKKLTDTIDAVGRGFDEFKRTNDERLKELAKGRTDPLVEEKLARITEDMQKGVELKDQLQKVADKHGALVERIDGMEVAMKRASTGSSGGIDEVKAADEFERASSMLQQRKYDENKAPDLVGFNGYQKAFNSMMRRDEKLLTGDEQKALSAGVLADGGYLLTPQVSNRIIGIIRESSPLRGAATVETIGTDTLEFLVDTGDVTMGWVGETAARPETATPQLVKRQIVTGEQYANPAITQKLLDDATMNPEMWLAQKVADKFARTEATAFVNGDGVNKPRGFLNYAAGSGLNQIPRFVFGATGGTPNVDADRLISMMFALKDPFASRAAWLMNRAVMPMIMRLKDGGGAYLWEPGLGMGVPSSILGRPVRFAADMPLPAPGAESLAFGDWQMAYTILDRVGIRTLRDPYTNKPYVHFYSTRRVGGAVVDFEALVIGQFGPAA